MERQLQRLTAEILSTVAASRLEVFGLTDKMFCNVHVLANVAGEDYNIPIGRISCHPNRLYQKLKSLKYVEKVRIEVV